VKITFQKIFGFSSIKMVLLKIKRKASGRTFEIEWLINFRKNYGWRIFGSRVIQEMRFYKEQPISLDIELLLFQKIYQNVENIKKNLFMCSNYEFEALQQSLFQNKNLKTCSLFDTGRRY